MVQEKGANFKGKGVDAPGQCTAHNPNNGRRCCKAAGHELSEEAGVAEHASPALAGTGFDYFARAPQCSDLEGCILEPDHVGPHAIPFPKSSNRYLYSDGATAWVAGEPGEVVDVGVPGICPVHGFECPEACPHGEALGTAAGPIGPGDRVLATRAGRRERWMAELANDATAAADALERLALADVPELEPTPAAMLEALRARALSALHAFRALALTLSVPSRAKGGAS